MFLAQWKRFLKSFPLTYYHNLLLTGMQEQLASLEDTLLQDKVTLRIQTWNALGMRNVSWIVSWTRLDSPVSTFRMPELYVQVHVCGRQGSVENGNLTSTALTHMFEIMEPL